MMNDTSIVQDIVSSLVRVLIGFSLASFFGVFLGSLTFYLRGGKKIVIGVFEFLKSIPPIAWIPIVILAFGLGNPSAIFIVFLGGFFPVFLNTSYGASSMPERYLDTARNFSIKGPDFYFKILLGYLMPYIFSGLKLGIGVSWMSVIAAEMVGIQDGLGYFIQINRLLLNTGNVIIGMGIIGFIGFAVTKALEQIEKKLMVKRGLN